MLVRLLVLTHVTLKRSLPRRSCLVYIFCQTTWNVSWTWTFSDLHQSLGLERSQPPESSMKRKDMQRLTMPILSVHRLQAVKHSGTVRGSLQFIIISFNKFGWLMAAQCAVRVCTASCLQLEATWQVSVVNSYICISIGAHSIKLSMTNNEAGKYQYWGIWSYGLLWEPLSC